VCVWVVCGLVCVVCVCVAYVCVACVCVCSVFVGVYVGLCEMCIWCFVYMGVLGFVRVCDVCVVDVWACGGVDSLCGVCT